MTRSDRLSWLIIALLASLVLLSVCEMPWAQQAARFVVHLLG